MEALRQHLERKGMTQEAFGKRLGVSQATVSDWLNGKFRPSAERLIRISEETGISVDKLLKGKPH